MKNSHPTPLSRRPAGPFRVALLALMLTLICGSAFGSTHWIQLGNAEVTLVDSDGWRDLGTGRDLPLAKGARIDHLSAGAGSWWVAAVEPSDGDDRLVLLKADSESMESLPLPVLERPEVLLQPRLMVGEAGLEALVWIEGESHQKTRVRAARWSAGGWAQPVTVAPTGPGTQIALQAVRLESGDFLAVWSAFDGTDDEIVWSRFDGQAWSAPEALSTNDVPDVTPALRAMEGGALLVWSAFDGNDYRLLTAAYTGSGWTSGQRFGKRGSVFPTFADTEVPMVVFQQSSPRSWVFSELNLRAQVLRSASVEYRRQRPIVRSRDARGVTISWPETGPAGTEKGKAAKTELESTVVEWALSVD